MSRRESYFTQQRIDAMYRATFYRGQIMTKPCPELKFNGHILVPFDTRWDGSCITLYYPPDTVLPANPMTFSEQLLDQNFILCGYGKNEVSSFVFVKALLRGAQ